MKITKKNAWEQMIEKSNMQKVGERKLFKKWFRQFKKADDATQLKMLKPK